MKTNYNQSILNWEGFIKHHNSKVLGRYWMKADQKIIADELHNNAVNHNMVNGDVVAYELGCHETISGHPDIIGLVIIDLEKSVFEF